MKLKGRITLSFPTSSSGEKWCEMQIEDELSGARFVEVRIDPQGFFDMMRSSYVPCELDVRGLNVLGKKMENDSFSFKIPESIPERSWKERDVYHKELQEYAQSLLDHRGDGWISDGYFGSQNSFFEQGKERWARTTIRRYMDVDTSKE